MSDMFLHNIFPYTV